jgi:predicted GH43/DUF377 family glycosyl hydrolase
MLRRFEGNPIIRREDVRPSQDGFEVYGVFNCGAVKVGSQYLLLMRVAERPSPQTGRILIPVLNDRCDGVQVRVLDTHTPGLDASDSRVVKLPDGHLMLTSISHLRLARSADGRRFSVDEKPALFPATAYERFGIEDPRITFLGGRWWVNYSAVSERGVVTALASTSDWQTFERHGVMFAPTDKDVCIFPERVGGRFVCRHRPWPQGFGEPAVWTAFSDDLLTWGDHRFTLGPRLGMWDEERVGCGPPPVRTEHGWLEIYHGSDRAGRYCLGALLTRLSDPTHVLARSNVPLLEPEADYETHGVYAPCVFCNGMVAEDDGVLRIYYGAADTVIAYAETTVRDVMEALF